MAETDSKPTNTDAKPDEVSLEQIDKLLEADDPAFAKSLSQIKEVGVEGEVHIESAVTGAETLTTEAEEDEKPKRRTWLVVLKPVHLVRDWIRTRLIKIRNTAVIVGRQFVMGLRTWPREFFGYAKAMFKILRQQLRDAMLVVRETSWPRRLVWTGFGAMVAATVILFVMSVSGIWLPGFMIHVETDLTKHADRSWEMKSDEAYVALFKAFPQKEIEFLFPKVVVNLKRTNSTQNPMGTFEVYVVLDSQDVAIEVEARRKELGDRLQRVLEDQTYADLSGPLGKKRIKDFLRRDLNAVLSQGWVKDVLIKNIILKP